MVHAFELIERRQVMTGNTKLFSKHTKCQMYYQVQQSSRIRLHELIPGIQHPPELFLVAKLDHGENAAKIHGIVTNSVPDYRAECACRFRQAQLKLSRVRHRPALYSPVQQQK